MGMAQEDRKVGRLGDGTDEVIGAPDSRGAGHHLPHVFRAYRWGCSSPSTSPPGGKGLRRLPHSEHPESQKTFLLFRSSSENPTEGTPPTASSSTSRHHGRQACDGASPRNRATLDPKRSSVATPAGSSDQKRSIQAGVDVGDAVSHRDDAAQPTRELVVDHRIARQELERLRVGSGDARGLVAANVERHVDCRLCARPESSSTRRPGRRRRSGTPTSAFLRRCTRGTCRGAPKAAG